MKTTILVASVAALAISAPAAAKPDKSGGGGKGGGQAAQVQRGGGGQARAAKMDRAPKAQAQRIERRGGGQARAAFQSHPGGGKSKAQRVGNRGGGQARFAAFPSQSGGKAKAQRVGNRGGGKAQRQEVRGRGRSDGARVRVADRRKEVRGRERIDLRGNRGRNQNEQRIVRVDREREFNNARSERFFGNRGVRTFANGCPPGLDQGDACMPWGQYKKRGTTLPAAYASNMLPLGLRDIYGDTDDYYHRYGDGYVYRVDRDDNLVSAMLPLIGAGLGIGMPFPYTGANYMVPSPYQSFYPSMGNDDYYRYANGYVYEIDQDTGLVEDMIPLLDRGYGVGQMLPTSYSAYNVPYQYRSMYYDTPESMYRYAPGAIYQVDPTTQLITAVASLLSPSGFAVGQPLPMGYDSYNVPLGYRDQYYDTADSWYRYNNGNIYQVDPTTRLITALITAVI